MINQNWSWHPLGELFEIGAGKTMSAAARAGSEKVPFLRTSNVFWDEIDLSEVDMMSISSSELVNKSLKVGDLLVCEGGEIGRAAIWDARIPVMSFQNHLHRLRPIKDDIDARFYVYFLQSAFTQLGIFEGAGNKTTIPNLSRNRLAALDIPLPPSNEQVAIAQSLAKVREAINAHEKATTTAQELKQAAMGKLFTRGVRGEAQKETDIGLVPNSWKFVRLEEAYETQLGKMLSQKARGGKSPKPYLRNKNVQWGYLNLSDILEMDFDERESKKFALKSGDLLVCEGGVIGRAAIWRGELAECYYQKALHRIRPRTEAANNEFLAYWLSFSFEYQNIYGIGGASSTIAHLPQVLLDGLKIPQPILGEQKEIVTILNAIDQKINLQKQKHAVLEELFKSLLHKLMTGEIRVSELNLSALSSNEVIS